MILERHLIYCTSFYIVGGRFFQQFMKPEKRFYPPSGSRPRKQGQIPSQLMIHSRSWNRSGSRAHIVMWVAETEISISQMSRWFGWLYGIFFISFSTPNISFVTKPKNEKKWKPQSFWRLNCKDQNHTVFWTCYRVGDLGQFDRGKSPFDRSWLSEVGSGSKIRLGSGGSKRVSSDRTEDIYQDRRQLKDHIRDSIILTQNLDQHAYVARDKELFLRCITRLFGSFQPEGTFLPLNHSTRRLGNNTNTSRLQQCIGI